jgi:ATP-dependent helicase HrpB
MKIHQQPPQKNKRQGIIQHQAEPLPLDTAWPELQGALVDHRNLVLVAEPGAGKTTRFPPLLLHSGLVAENQKILVLEPRRLAARAAAARIAEEQVWHLGNEIGYQVRFENKTSPSTRIQILTEGLLARRLQTDSELTDVGAIILDEFHERSLHTDLAIGLLMELQELARPDLRIIVMSATIDAERVAQFLGGAPIVRVPGRMHPVEIHHAQRPLILDTGAAFIESVAESVLNLIDGVAKKSGDVLVFLPGAREIRSVRMRIESRADQAGFDCMELHGSLALEEQDRTLRRSQTGRSRIVLATNIAETSLTLDGIGTVVDSGLARVMRVDAAGFPRLQISRISLASATQRAGRAGRQGPGICYRLWNKLDEASMPPFEQPEILRADLTEPLLILASQGVADPNNFSWFEKPEEEALRSAMETLKNLEFIQLKDSSLTPNGREALKLPLAPRLARLVLESLRVDCISLGAQLAAILSERDFVRNSAQLKNSASIESDPLLRLHLLVEKNSIPSDVEIDRIAQRNLQRVSKAIEAQARRVNLAADTKQISSVATGGSSQWARDLGADEIALRLLLLSFPDRVARRRRPKELAARMVGGRGVVLSPYSSVETATYFLALDSSEPPSQLASSIRASPRSSPRSSVRSTGSSAVRSDAQISVASRIEREWLESHFPSSISTLSRIVFDEETESVQIHRASSFRDLPLEDPKVSRPTADEAFATLIAACESRWFSHFASHPLLSEFMTRLHFAREFLPDGSSPEGAALRFDETGVRSSFLEEVCFAETRLTDVLAKQLIEIYTRHLPPGVASIVDDLAPSALVVPSGSRIRIQYPEDRAPFIEVRIQEVFGWTASPRIGRGKIAIQLHLLGPNYRPVQVTSDLESFWKNGYSEVRKELRARYPKHSWPEDPFTARPEAKGRPRR